MAFVTTGKKEPQRYVSFGHLNIPQRQATLLPEAPRAALPPLGAMEGGGLGRLAAQLRVLVWIAALLLSIQFLGWMSRQNPETPLDFSLREHKHP